MRLSRGVAAVLADPVFQEALTWQNPGLTEFLQVHGIRQGPARRTRDRDRELVVASYLQRYCLKNDSIGFFGPVGWASVNPGTAGLVVMPGERLIARRTTHFEVWAMEKVAAGIAREGRVLGWRRPVVLTDAELAILAACDGCRTISDVLGAAGVTGGRGLLTRLAELGALRLDLESPMHSWRNGCCGTSWS